MPFSIHTSSYNFSNLPTVKTNFSSSCFSLILHKSHTNICVVLHRKKKRKKATKWMSVLNLWQERRVRIFLYLIKFKNMKLTVTKSIIFFLFHAVVLSLLENIRDDKFWWKHRKERGERRTLKRDFSSSFYAFLPIWFSSLSIFKYFFPQTSYARKRREKWEWRERKSDLTASILVSI